MKKIKNPDVVKAINGYFKNFCKLVQDNCSYYSFFRCHIYSTDEGSVCLDFLANDANGNFKKPSIEIDTETDVIYYGNRDKFGFTKAVEKHILQEVYKIIEVLSEKIGAISNILVDFNMYSDFKYGLCDKDPNEEGSIMLFMLCYRSYENNYCLADAKDVCGKFLTADYDYDSE